MFTNIAIEKILQANQEQEIPEDEVAIGEQSRVDASEVIQIMNTWCQRVDLLIENNKRTHKRYTEFAHSLMRVRGVTYLEYIDVFNDQIDESEFWKYLGFSILGVNNKRQRFAFTQKYTTDEEDYKTCLKSLGFTPLLNFFLRKKPKLSTVPIEAKTMHEIILAPTGAGKSVLLATQTYFDSYRLPHWGQVFIDPHGSAARLAFSSKLQDYENRVMFFDVRQILNGYRWGINPLDVRDINPIQKDNIVDQISSSFSDVLSKEGGEIRQNMDTLIKKCVRFLIDRDQVSTLMDLYDLCNKEPKILKEAQAYNEYFGEKFKKQSGSTLKAVVTRLDSILDSELVRSCIAGHATFDFQKALNSNKIMIFDLSAFGEDSQGVIGKFLFAMVKGYTRRRIKDEDDYHNLLRADEFEMFITGSLKFMLEQLRGYGLHCSFACQSVSQLGNYLQTIKDNCAIKIVSSKYEENIRPLVKVPEKYIKRTKRGGDSAQADGMLTLGKREFLLDVRQRQNITSFNAPGLLVTSNRKRLTHEQVEKQMERQLKEYYAPIDAKGNPKDFRDIDDDIDLDAFDVAE